MTEVSSRTVYFVSESTGITAEAYGLSLLSQFGDVDFVKRYTPFINTRDKAQALSNELAHRAEAEGQRPIVFATMVDDEISQVLKHADCHYFELFERFMPDLIEATGVQPTPQSGISHGLVNPENYEARIDTINYALSNDDGMRLNKFDQADIIVIGCGHTEFAEIDPEHAASLLATKRIFDPTGTIDRMRWQRLGFHVVHR